MAERVGFEPTIRVNVYTLSKRAPSATRPPLLALASKNINPVPRNLAGLPPKPGPYRKRLAGATVSGGERIAWESRVKPVRLLP